MLHNMRIRKGFTLIELLVVIAIIAILAAILFPVFARAREKARQIACMNNQRQIALAVMMYTQDHDETLPDASSIWGAINLGNKVLVCPTAGSNIGNGYVYNNLWAGAALGQVDPPTTSVLLGDGSHAATLETSTNYATYGNTFYAQADLKKRHDGKYEITFADGHVKLIGADLAANQFKSPAKPTGASVIIKPTAAVASSYWSDGLPAPDPDERSGAHAVDGSGLSADLITGAAIPATAADWPTHSNNPACTMWISNNEGPGATITFTLGGTYTITGFHLWNYNESGYSASGLETVGIEASTTGSFTGTPNATAGPFTQAPGAIDYKGETYNLASPVTASSIRFTVNTFFDPVNMGPYCGIAEIRFLGH